MKRISCSHDDMRNKHLEVMAWCLAKYFGHTEETATVAVERYYDTWKGITTMMSISMKAPTGWRFVFTSSRT